MIMKSFKILFILPALVILALGVSCNKKNSDDDTLYVYTTSTSSTLVSSFRLQADAEVMAHLDSVYFTIDPERGLIYNADSLPKGTNISSLKATVAFRSSIGKAVFNVMDADHVSTEHEYSSASSTAMDFRYGVVLAVTSLDGLHTKEYTVKVNVHQQEPDTLVWPMAYRRNLPASAHENYAVGTAHFDGAYWCLLHSSDGFVMSKAATPSGPWTQPDVEFGFEPDAATLTASDDALYLLDVNGNLCYSTDGLNWSQAGVKWKSLIGGYGDRVLGVTAEPYCYDEYPRRDDYEPVPIAHDFPIAGASQLMVTTADWAVADQAVMAGGVTAQGELISHSWGYDGNSWAIISGSQNVLPAIEAPTVFSYYTFTTDETTLVTTKHETMMLMGGKLSDGSLNTATYVSKNRGISWTKGGTALSMPNVQAPFYGASAQVCIKQIPAAAGSNGAQRRVAQVANQWDCPYIYIFGGYDSHGNLQNNIWQGVLTRFTFKPLQ